MNWIDTLIKALIWTGVPIVLLLIFVSALIVAAALFFYFVVYKKIWKKVSVDFQKQSSEQKLFFDYFKKSKAKEVGNREKLPTFKDVGGMPEVVEEVKEIVEFLEKPKKFKEIGARMPKGVLLCGRPGTGKTLLAKALAGETGVKYYAVSGSGFVEMLVGVGSSRFRDLFEEAKKNAPSIIFIDEIDAVGKKRSAMAVFGGDMEAGQTLNQLLHEMDGFEDNSGVMILAATNREDTLDPALTRKGRFDRIIYVPAPDLAARKEILRIHLEKIKLTPDFDIEKAAGSTYGYVGADLENVVNEAAILAVREGKVMVNNTDFDEAETKVSVGLMRGIKQTDKEKRVLAYHEAGHAFVGLLTKAPIELRKISIVPREKAGGFTKFNPEEERHLYFRKEFLSFITGFLGGYAAESLVFGDITNGASNDIEKTTIFAREMVSKFGMCDRIGPLKFSKGSLFTDNFEDKAGACSEFMAQTVDKEVKRIGEECLSVAKNLLSENRQALDELADLLVKEETVEGEAAKKILEKYSPKKKDANHGNSSSYIG